MTSQERRRRVFQFIADHLERKGYPPSYREIADGLGIASTSTVYRDVHALISERWLSMEKGVYRSLQVVHKKASAGGAAAAKKTAAPEKKASAPLQVPSPSAPAPKHAPVSGARPASSRENTSAPPVSDWSDQVMALPLYGAVAAGAPIYAEDHVEDALYLPRSFFRQDGSSYFILQVHGESMIEAGIYDGDHVIVKQQDTARDGQQVVALIDDSATVKTFYRHRDYIELRPENAAMAPILVQDCRILGVVTGLYRLYR